MQTPRTRYGALARAAALTTALVVAGCGTGMGSPAATKQAPTMSVPTPVIPLPTARPSAPPSPGPIPARTMSIAWGNVVIRHQNSALGADRMFSFAYSATPDGRWLVGTDGPRTLADRTDPSYAVLRDAASGAVIRMATLANPSSQILAASADDRWVVWTEADDPAIYDWRLMAYDIKTAHAHEIARATRQAGKPVPGPAPWPQVSNGRLVWGQAIGPLSSASSLASAVVRIEDLATGSMTTLRTSAFAPALSWPWVAWVTGSDAASTSIEVRNLTTGRAIRVAAQPSRFALDGSSLVLDDHERLASMALVDDVLNDPSPRVLARALDNGDHLEWPSINARIVAWNQDSITQVYDRAERCLVLIEGYANPTVVVTERLLLWTSMPQGQANLDMQKGLRPNYEIYYVDTSTLSVVP